MADRRMFTKKITNSDAFLEMSSAAQSLYFHLNQEADDDGFNNQIQAAMFRAHAGVDDLKVLLMKNFIIRFDSGVIVIKHWRMHNALRKDRYNPTSFQDELSLLNVKYNGSYTLVGDSGCHLVANLAPQVRVGKDSTDKINKKSGHFVPPSLEEIKEYCQSRNNKIDAESFLAFYTSKDWMIGKNKMKDWKSAIITWEKRDKKVTQEPKAPTPSKFNNHDQRQYSAMDYADLEKKLTNKGL